MSFPLPDDHADIAFYESLLRELDAPVTNNNLASLYAWRQSEGGSATYNPFNTTYSMPGATLYANSSHGVKNYRTPQDGLDATVKTLQLDYYTDVVRVLRNDGTPEEFARAVGNSRWGTNYKLLSDVVAMFRRGRVVFAPLATRSDAPPISSLRKSLIPPVFVKAEPSESRPSPEPFNYWWLFPVGITIALVTATSIVVVRRRQRKPRSQLLQRTYRSR